MDPTAGATDDKDYAALIARELPLLRRLTDRIVARTALPWEDRDDILSLVLLKLVDDDYAALRAFGGRCRLSTYLTVVIRRVVLDYQIGMWGKWRAPADVRREGPLAVQMDGLIAKRGFTFDEACAHIEASGTKLRPETRARLYELVGERCRRRVVALDGISEPAVAPDLASQREVRRSVRRLSRGLRTALGKLRARDRALLAMRFRDDLPLATIARRVGVEQKLFYRHFSVILRTLRRHLEAAGVTAEEALAALGHPEQSVCPLLTSAMLQDSAAQRKARVPTQVLPEILADADAP